MGNSTAKPNDYTFSRDSILFSEDAKERIMSGPPQKTVTSSKPQEVEPNTTASPTKDLNMHFKYELETIEKRYEDRLAQLERQDEVVFKEAADEFTGTVERLENKYMRPTPGACCEGPQQRLEDCVNKNPDNFLNCTKLLNTYIACVSKYRVAMSNKLKDSAA